LLSRCGYTGIEVAPTKIWPKWDGASRDASSVYRSKLHDQGFVVPAFQAIFYGFTRENFFDPADQNVLVDHFHHVASLANAMECPVLVIGAPKMRIPPNGLTEYAKNNARSLFASFAQIAHDQGTCACIEPNPAAYGCEYIVNSAEAIQLVHEINHPGFGLHIDAAAMSMEKEDGVEVIRAHADEIKHFHVSEPFLSGLSNSGIDHRSNLLQLADSRYPHWVSLESTGVDQGKQSIEILSNWTKR
jgi:sugar phosphate isomerase/epimerase